MQYPSTSFALISKNHNELHIQRSANEFTFVIRLFNQLLPMIQFYFNPMVKFKLKMKDDYNSLLTNIKKRNQSKAMKLKHQ